VDSTLDLQSNVLPDARSNPGFTKTQIPTWDEVQWCDFTSSAPWGVEGLAFEA